MPKRKRKNDNKQPALFLFIGGGIILLIAAFLLFNQNSSTATTAQEDIPYPEIQRVSLADAKSALDAGTAVFVDVRSAEAFAGQHITDSLNIPTTELEARLAELDPNQWIIPYCT